MIARPTDLDKVTWTEAIVNVARTAPSALLFEHGQPPMSAVRRVTAKGVLPLQAWLPSGVHMGARLPSR